MEFVFRFFFDIMKTIPLSNNLIHYLCYTSLYYIPGFRGGAKKAAALGPSIRGAQYSDNGKIQIIIT